MKIIFLFMALFSLLSCKTGLVPHSKRDLGGIPKMGTDKVVGNHRPLKSKNRKRNDFYIKDDNIRILEKEQKNTTGSLFQLNDSRNYYFMSRSPVKIGDFVEIQVNTHLLPGEKKADGDKGEKSEGNKNFGEIEQAIKDALPDLTPLDQKNAKILKRFKMRVEHQYENGDVMVRYKRGSLLDNYANEIHVTARIPYENLISGNPLQTTDLGNVHWRESVEGEFAERYSSSWEDQYTARISGFSEAKSKYAMELDAKRDQLNAAKERLENRLEAMGNERAKLARERADLGEKQRNHEDTMKELNNKITVQEEVIKRQKAEIENLKPEEKPGDGKEGAGGA